MKTLSQKKAILDYLMKGKPLTPIEALNKFGCFRLSARIKELRDEGFYIITKQIEVNGSRFAQYFLIDTHRLPE